MLVGLLYFLVIIKEMLENLINEFKTIDLRDKRLDRRLKTTVDCFAKKSGESIPKMCKNIPPFVLIN